MGLVVGLMGLAMASYGDYGVLTEPSKSTDHPSCNRGIQRYPFYTTPIPKEGPDRPYLSLVWALFRDGGSIEGGILDAYDVQSCLATQVLLEVWAPDLGPYLWTQSKGCWVGPYSRNTWLGHSVSGAVGEDWPVYKRYVLIVGTPLWIRLEGPVQNPLTPRARCSLIEEYALNYVTRKTLRTSIEKVFGPNVCAFLWGCWAMFSLRVRDPEYDSRSIA